MKGVILAAGKGSRLYPVTHVIPKPLLPLANRMTMEYAFDQLKDCGITEICIVVGENEEVMKETLGDGSAFGVQLSFVRQTEPKGLAHAVGFTKEFVGNDAFVLYLGDAIYGDSLSPHIEKFKSEQADNLNLVKPVEDPRRFGVATVSDDGRISKLVEKPENPESNLAMAGMYVFTNAVFDVLPKLQPSGRGEYEITDAIQMMIDEGKKVIASEYKGTWFDTGTLSSFLQTSQYLQKEDPLVGPQAGLQGEPGEHVVIGEGAKVTCEQIENSVVLPGSDVEVSGVISGSLLGGRVSVKGDLVGKVRQDDQER
jgi:glucose-1-phosphate thymidylyltransferase